MANDTKVDDAEKAYAAAASDVKAVTKAVEAAIVESAKPAVAMAKVVAAAPPVSPPVAAPAKVAKKPVKAAPVKRKAVKAKPVAKPVAKVAAKPIKAAPKFKPTRKPAVRVSAAKLPVLPIPSLTQLKDAIMTTKTNTYTKPMTDALGELQTRAKTAYDKSTAVMTDATEFAKGNVEAMVATSKLLAGGVKGMGKTYVEEAKTAYETMTADVKELAAVKSPTELFQLQGKIIRRNFDAMVSTSTKNSDAMIKLMTKAFAPMTDRVTLAADKIAKAA